MGTANEVELAAFVEKLTTDELPSAAARLFQKWCESRGDAPHDAVHGFLGAVTEHQTGEVRLHLDQLLAR